MECWLGSFVIIRGSVPVLVRNHVLFFLWVTSPLWIPACGTTRFIISDAPIDYECFSDGTVLVSNPRNELFQYSYSESDNIPCQSMYINGGDKILIFDCDLVCITSLYPLCSQFCLKKSIIRKKHTNTHNRPTHGNVRNRTYNHGVLRIELKFLL